MTNIYAVYEFALTVTVYWTFRESVVAVC